MNVLELLRKRDANVRLWQWTPQAGEWRIHPDPLNLSSKVRNFSPRASLKSPVQTVRGLSFPPGTRMSIARASRFWPDTAKGAGSFLGQAPHSSQGCLLVGWKSAGGDDSPLKIEFGSELTRFAIPPCRLPEADLIIEAPVENPGPVFLGVHRLLDRSELYGYCVGRGVEIGPGPKPQILPGWRTRISYVEQATPDQWRDLYGKGAAVPVNRSLWNHYVVGNADNIPASTGSLDFIFSSHVLEHLANPLGHLGYWATLLKPRGVVLAVIPDREGCKDYVFPSSSIEELLDEWASGGMCPTLSHYERWAAHRAPKADPHDIMASGRSIHVHFYTPSSMAGILGRMCVQLGYRSFHITAEPNHKDFHLVLQK